jgi:hypothetical protein
MSAAKMQVIWAVKRLSPNTIIINFFYTEITPSAYLWPSPPYKRFYKHNKAFFSALGFWTRPPTEITSNLGGRAVIQSWFQD